MAVTIGPAPGEHVVFLKVPWRTYQALGADIGDDSGTLMAYDGVTLELMSPTTDHEAYAKLLDALLTIVVTEWELNLYNTGFTTLKAEPLGAEPDTSYSIENAGKVDGMQKIDLLVSPPPDLVVEIDISHRRMDKLALYARFGVPEFWRYSRGGLQAFALTNGVYKQIGASVVIGGLPLAVIEAFLERRLESNRQAIFRNWQTWLRENRQLHASEPHS